MVGEGDVARSRRPIGSEVVIGLPAEQVGICGLHAVGDTLGETLIVVGDRPTAVPETTFSVLVWLTWCLHHTVQGYEVDDREFSHQNPPLRAGGPSQCSDCLRPRKSSLPTYDDEFRS